MIKHSENPFELFSKHSSVNNEIFNWVQYSFKLHTYIIANLFLTETDWGKRVNWYHNN